MPSDNGGAGFKDDAPGDIKLLFAFSRPYVWIIVISLFFHICANGLAMLNPFFIKVIIDHALGESRMWLLAAILCAMIGAKGLGGVFAIVANYFMYVATTRMLLNMRVKLFKHIQSLSLRFYQEYRMGRLISNIITDVSVLQGVLTNVIVQLSVHIFTAAFICVALALLSPKLSLICLALAPAQFLLFSYFGRALKRDSEALRERMSEISANLAEVINGIKVVKSFGKERRETLEFAKSLKPTFAMSLSFSMKAVCAWIAAEQVVILCLVTSLGFGGYMVTKGDMTIGTLVAFYTYLSLLSGPVNGMTSLFPAISDGSVSAGRLKRLMDEVPDVKERPNPVRMGRAAGRMTFEGAGFQYPSGRQALNGFSLDVKPGMKVALVGPSGSGKSTIASVLMRFYDVTSGRILLDGVDIRDLELESLRCNIGIVLQESFFFSGTVEENIHYGKKDASLDDVIAAAKIANAHEFIEKLPKGYKTEIGENGVSLSGGQRQRLAIARAALYNPSVLILDEATSALDTVSESVVQEALEKLMEGRTAIIIAHRLSTVRNADLIVVLKEGRIVQKGRHDDLLFEDGLYRELYATQLKEVYSAAPRPPPKTLGGYDGMAVA